MPKNAAFCRVATIDLTRTAGGVYSGDSDAPASSDSGGSATASPPAARPFFSSRASLMIRKGLTKVSGIVGQGSAFASSLVMVISRPILSSRQCPSRVSASVGSAIAEAASPLVGSVLTAVWASAPTAADPAATAPPAMVPGSAAAAGSCSVCSRI